jgi:D-ribulokinase
MVISGGAARSPLVRQIMADTTGLDIALPATPEPVLLGAAMLGAVAGQAFPSVDQAMRTMSKIAQVTHRTASMAGFHAAKRKIYTRLRELDRDARTIMRGI